MRRTSSLRIAPSNVAGALGACRSVRSGESARASDRQRHGVHRLAQSRSGPRDDVRADRRRAARDSGGERPERRARRHGSRAVQLRCLWLALARGRRHAGGGRRALDKIVAKGKKMRSTCSRRPRATSSSPAARPPVAGTDRDKSFGEVALTAYVPHGIARQARAERTNPRSTARPTSRSRPAHLRSRDLARHRRGGSRADRLRRLRQHHQSDDRRRPGPWRPCARASNRRCSNCVYDESGQLLTGSYMDYAMPRADDLPSFKVATTVTPCTHNPLGAKGCGEAGAIGAPAALMNAVDALSAAGVLRASTCPLRRTAYGRRSSRPAAPRRRLMYAFELHKAKSVADAQRCSRRAGAPASRRAEPDRRDAPAAPATRLAGGSVGHRRTARHPQGGQCARDRGNRASRGSRGVRRRESDDSGARGACGGSATGRSATWVRSAAPIANDDHAADCTAGSGRPAPPSSPAGGSYRAVTSSRNSTKPHSPTTRSSPRPAFPFPARGLCGFSNPVLVRRFGVFVAQTADGSVRVAVTGARPSVFLADQHRKPRSPRASPPMPRVRPSCRPAG